MGDDAQPERSEAPETSSAPTDTVVPESGVPAGEVRSGPSLDLTGGGAQNGAGLRIVVSPSGADVGAGILRAKARSTSARRSRFKAKKSEPTPRPTAKPKPDVRQELEAQPKPRARQTAGTEPKAPRSASAVAGWLGAFGRPAGTAAALGGIAACIVVGFAAGGGFSGSAAITDGQTAEGEDVRNASVESQSGAGPGDAGPVDAAGEQSVAPAGAGEAAAHCPEVVAPGHYAGAGAGDEATPEGVVAAFEHAYYVVKDASAATALVTPDASIDAETLRREGIDRLPAGTTHCVDARAGQDGAVEVVLVEARPGQPELEIRQRITTAAGEGGKRKITGIEHLAPS